MPQLRTRIPKNTQTVTVDIDQLKSLKKLKPIIINKKKNGKIFVQTFVAKDKDITTVTTYPKTQRERTEYVNFKTGKRVTPFQYRVYDLTSQIPSGQVSSYKALSDSLKASPRAVGQALRHNPFAPLPIPCHRVIATDYSIGGFNGGFGDHQLTANKKEKLMLEGCQFEKGNYTFTSDKLGSKVFFKDFQL